MARARARARARTRAMARPRVRSAGTQVTQARFSHGQSIDAVPVTLMTPNQPPLGDVGLTCVVGIAVSPVYSVQKEPP